LRPYLLVALLLRVIFEFRSFDNVYILTGGGPANATMLMSMYTYINTFVAFDLGYGAATSWIMLLVTMVTCMGFIWSLRAYGRD
jgi:multiple sugar transport system permease protein